MMTNEPPMPPQNWKRTSNTGVPVKLKPPKPPPNLGVEGRRFWREVLSQYLLRPDEVAVLEHACRTLSLIAQLQTELDASGLMVKGSMGQDVANPLLAEIRQQRNLLRALMKQLAIPDEDGGDPGALRSINARKAARARWGGGGR